ncbi:MAG TPA: NFACT RNA binding domain-containing protein [Bacillota bacterium]|nr:NFACT RNA binding domain-containing protein [Bacillota bacterium]
MEKRGLHGLQIDGFLLSAVAAEIRSELVGTRIDRVYSASRDCIVIAADRGRARRLVVSASQAAPRVCLTSAPPASLPEPTPFAMLLRKHLTGGRIVAVRQLDLDRVLTIQVEGWADADASQNKLLIAEITGRLSNIVLTDMEGRILDAVRRVDQSRNRYRELVPGAVYLPPPPMDRIDPRETQTPEAFMAAIRRHVLQAQARGQAQTPGQASASASADGIGAVLARCFAGIGPTLGSELAFRAGLDPAQAAVELGDAELSGIWEPFSAFMRTAQAGQTERSVFEAALERTTERDAAQAVAMSCGGLSHLADTFHIERFASASDMIDTCYFRAEERGRLEERRRTLAREVGARLERNLRKLQAQREELARAGQSDHLRRQGELLTANLSLFGNGPLRVDRVRAVDYYDPDMAEVEVEVDPSMSASANAQALFARYARAQRAIEAVAANTRATEGDIAYLESVAALIDMADDIEHLESVQEELEALGYTGSGRFAQKAGQRSARGRRADAHMPTKYTARSGHEIYVGRNNLQNDHLTLKLARGQDLWFHAKDVHGSHVVLRRRSGEEVPEATMRAAALLAAYYSRARMSSNVAVDCTEAKNVRKPRGARPGMVIYDRHRTIWITPSREEIAEAFGLNGAALDRTHD